MKKEDYFKLIAKNKLLVVKVDNSVYVKKPSKRWIPGIRLCECEDEAAADFIVDIINEYKEIYKFAHGEWPE